MNSMSAYAALIGRIMLASILVLAGFGTIGTFQDSALYMVGAGTPAIGSPVTTLLVLTILIELGGGIAIALGWKTRPAAVAVLAVTAVATLVFHHFRDATPGDAMAQQLMFMKNVSVMGGLLLLYAFGPGRYAFDEMERSLDDGSYWRGPDDFVATQASGTA
jgi:putative oxidoreductase